MLDSLRIGCSGDLDLLPGGLQLLRDQSTGFQPGYRVILAAGDGLGNLHIRPVTAMVEVLTLELHLWQILDVQLARAMGLGRLLTSNRRMVSNRLLRLVGYSGCRCSCADLAGMVCRERKHRAQRPQMHHWHQVLVEYGMTASSYDHTHQVHHQLRCHVHEVMSHRILQLLEKIHARMAHLDSCRNLDKAADEAHLFHHMVHLGNCRLHNSGSGSHTQRSRGWNSMGDRMGSSLLGVVVGGPAEVVLLDQHLAVEHLGLVWCVHCSDLHQLSHSETDLLEQSFVEIETKNRTEGR